MIWTDERKAVLRELVAQNLSCGLIAAQLGVSRNAVIGAMHRMGIRSLVPQGEISVRTSAKPRAPRKPYRRPINRAPSPIAFAPERSKNPCDIIAIASDQCRWPVEGEGLNTLFCGAPALAKRSYCADHCRRAFSYVPVLTRAEIEIHRRRLAKSETAQAIKAVE